ncbi:diguanylate cyclase (GGDEF) domain-containing protein [Cohaesibacter sp. ES.047]|uniref:bifunctional diguanylate cyclase/phosphodiesterase n=1 Tax=Cohaesibacter sp. ES.047 TaxID=1798205 RepID=UPI000BB7F9B3|nr:EAL domain-containing protein [Cohaesibacter sp. ES.047]SNY91845.1 diguanylate cyclase (GGDEF) domain-containing protein [Cohaesibacter sp. ES.047]
MIEYGSANNSLWQQVRFLIWNPANLPALIAVVVLVAATLFAEHITESSEAQQERSALQNKATVMAAKLQAHMSPSIELARGLSAMISTEPDIDQEHFSDLARNLFHQHSHLINIAGVPGMVVKMVYPEQENRKVLGLDLRKHETQRELALKTRDENTPTLAGPVALIQGGEAFIVRYPIYYDDKVVGRQFWGLLSLVIDIAEIYDHTGLDEQSNVSFALLGRDGKGENGALFYGSGAVLASQPVEAVVDFGFASWVLKAIPKGGWQAGTHRTKLIRLVAALAFLLIVIPFLFVGWLYRDRLVHLRERIIRDHALTDANKRLQLALDASGIAVWEMDPKTGIAKWDRRFLKQFGLDPEGKDHSDLQALLTWLPIVDRDATLDAIREALKSKGRFRSDYRVAMQDGVQKHFRTVGSFLKDENGGRRLVGLNWDITTDVEREKELCLARTESDERNQELEEAKARLEALAKHDFLTRLPNRRYLDEKLTGSEYEPSLMSETLQMLKIDLDGFKDINDSFGHAAGDIMLRRTADLLRSAIKEGEFAARIGGDEFVLLCDSAKEPSRPETLAKQLLSEIDRPIDYRGRTCRLGMSIGISSGKDAFLDADKMLSNSDLALYQVKQKGKGGFEVFSQPLYQRVRQERELAEDLLRAIETREFIAHFQGQYCAKTHNLVGVEALVRWNHPRRGMLQPCEFLGLAESLGLTSTIDALVLDQTIEAKAFWEKRGLTVPRVSVNVSARRLGDADLISKLKKIDFDWRSLTFELLESTFLDHSDTQVAANIRQIRNMGIEIEIDDFGTAYASIVSLTHLLPHRLKIDRELIQPVINSTDQRELVHSIIQIGRTLGIGTVAEGVETMVHADILEAMGVDVLQGYAFCRPVTAERFLRHNKERQLGKIGQSGRR